MGSESSSINQQNLSQEPTAPSPKAKKPPLARRASSRHRGQEFSVDDDPVEYEEDQAKRHGPTAPHSHGHVRRMPSTLRRRPTVQPSTLARVDSYREGEEAEQRAAGEAAHGVEENSPNTGDSGEEGTIRAADSGDGCIEDEVDDEDSVSDAESFTLKDKQDAINETHPFGIRIWKPALYRKDRSVQKTAEGDIHSSPGGKVSRWLFLFNILWTILFGWWLALAAAVGAIVCLVFGFAPGSMEYGGVLIGLARYVLFPFGLFVRLDQDDAYADEDEGEGRSISEYEQWQSGDLEDGRLFFGPVSTRSIVGRRRNSLESASENDSLLGRNARTEQSDDAQVKQKRRFFGRGEWTVGRVIFFIFFYGLITPGLFFASAMCWLMVFWIPMGKVTLLLFYHLRRHPLALSFHADSAYSRRPGSSSSSILVCTYRAVGMKYWKYTVDGTNIILIDLMGIVLFVIFDYWILKVALGLDLGITHPAFIFTLSICSIIPLAYFIGQAVASISAQSSMGVGAAINAFFSTLVEVFLYCVALNQGKGQLVEGSLVGSIFAGILFLPGISMCFGALKRKTQRFNAKSAGVTSTMLLFAVIAAFGPTLFYQIYGTHELNCRTCVDTLDGDKRDCRRCYFSQVPAVNDRFFVQAVRPYCWFAASLLFLSYIIGLWFTLRTHAANIWALEPDEKKVPQTTGSTPNTNALQPPDHRGSTSSAHYNALTRQNTSGTIETSATIRDSQLYKRILGQSLRQISIPSRLSEESRNPQLPNSALPPHIVPPRSSGGDTTKSVGSSSPRSMHITGFSDEQNQDLVRNVAELAATAATVAARDAVRNPRKTSLGSHVPSHRPHLPKTITLAPGHEHDEALHSEHGAQGGGHDAPNWSRAKSSIVLLGATVLYGLIAEILVNTVDVVLESVDIDEKFLGITLFALVPNTTEFLVSNTLGALYCIPQANHLLRMPYLLR